MTAATILSSAFHRSGRHRSPASADGPAATGRGLVVRDVAALLAVPVLVLSLVGWYHGSASFPEPPFAGFIPLLAVLACLGAVISIALAVEVVRLRAVVRSGARAALVSVSGAHGLPIVAERAPSTMASLVDPQVAVDRIRRLEREVDTLCAIRNLSIIANDDVDLRRVLENALGVVEQVLDAIEVQVYLRRGDEDPSGLPDASRLGGQTSFSAHTGIAHVRRRDDNDGEATETGGPKGGKKPKKRGRSATATLAKLAAKALDEQRSVSRVEKLKVSVAVMLTADGETLGALVARAPRADGDPAASIQTLEALAKPIALAIRKPALYERAVFDALTGLYTKRHFTEQLQRLFGQARRVGTPLALILCDIDHFKAVNDTHGHLAGDDVLAAVARAIRETVRDYDSAYRYGGEEMAVLSPNVTPENAAVLGERIRAAVAALAIPVEGGAIVEPKISVGIASWRPGLPAPQELIATADRALYAAKEGGRNRVVTEDDLADAIPARQPGAETTGRRAVVAAPAS